MTILLNFRPAEEGCEEVLRRRQADRGGGGAGGPLPRAPPGHHGGPHLRLPVPPHPDRRQHRRQELAPPLLHGRHLRRGLGPHRRGRLLRPPRPGPRRDQHQAAAVGHRRAGAVQVSALHESIIPDLSHL